MSQTYENVERFKWFSKHFGDYSVQVRELKVLRSLELKTLDTPILRAEINTEGSKIVSLELLATKYNNCKKYILC